ncbi:MAG: ABC transporter ATP-binding protein [Clostridiales bacterium]|nr:ABC transporter ATP-binding protein [Clostridiales bacterium]
MPKIVLTDVTKRWGNFYGVDHLDLVIDDCSFVTLLGPSGCGKTTTLRMIAGLETPTSGRIEIGDQVVFDSELGINVPANKRHVGFLFQNYALWPNMTVYQNISFGLKNMKMPKEEIEATVSRVAKLVKIEQFMDRYPAELSGGQQQRVAIARTLAPDPEVIFMDEPLSNLDAKLRLEMRAELQRLHLNTHKTFIYVTHDQMEAMTLATRICLIDNGVLQQYDPPLKVYGQPNNIFVADFVGSPSINFVDANGTQNEDGSMSLKVFGDIDAKFDFKEQTDLNAWREQEAAEEKQEEEKVAKLATQKGYVEKKNVREPFRYQVNCVDEEARVKTEPTDDNFVIGIRPETIKICESGGIQGEIYSAMPTGMETTLRIRVGNFILTSVIFGGITYDIGQMVNIKFDGDGIMLFSRKSDKLIGLGTISL